MSTESLIVKLEADNAQLNKDLATTSKRLDDLEGMTSKTDGSFNKFTKGTLAVAKGVTTVAAAATAAAAALTAMVVASAKSEQEMNNLANTAKKTREEFDGIAFAFSTVGVDAKGTADALNDVSERIGEFAAAGSGAFQDFADVMKLDADQAKALATELQYLSGDEAVGYMVSEMEAASVPAAQMSFVMKSLSNDLEYASELFKDNGAQLNTLSTMYNKATQSLALNSEETAKLQEANVSFDLMVDALGRAGTLISAQLAPLLNEFFLGVIEVVPEATQKIVDFINSFKSPEEITNQQSLINQIEESKEKIAEHNSVIEQAQANMYKLSYEHANYADVVDFSTRTIETRNERLNEELEILAQLEAQLELVTEKEKAATDEAERRLGITATLGDIDGLGSGEGGEFSAELQAIEDRFKSEEELLQEKLDRELQIVGDNEQLKFELRKEYADKIKEIEQERLDEEERINQESAQAALNTMLTKIDAANSYLSAASQINQALLDDNKAVGAGIIVADTAIAIMKAYAQLGPIKGTIAAVGLAATGLTQLASLKSASSGSSSSSISTASAATTVESSSSSDSTSATSSDSTVTDTSVQQVTNLTIALQGDTVSRDSFNSVVNEINDRIANGEKINSVNLV